MRYSQLFGKTTKNASKDAQLTSHRLLLQGGFIRESVAGRYFLLPLAMRVRNKIVEIIRQEMNAAGAQEMISPILHPLELWQETNRDNAGNFGLMTVEDRRGSAFALGGTAEEMFVDVVRKFQLSYRDLPINIYQFSQKFRDELRARGGLLRVREFLMKDAYSFDTDADAFTNTYQTMATTYSRIFERVGLPTKQVLADNGYIGGEYCHEFVVECAVGESRFLQTADGSYCAHEDVAQIQVQPMNPDEPLADFEIIDQPQWVKTTEDSCKHYGAPAWRFMKNVVFKRIDTGQLVIATIRGDLQVNKTKVEHAVGAIELLDTASAEDLARIGTQPGYVHAWGHDALYVADHSLKSVRNFIGGQKEDSTDSKNVNYGRDFTADIEADICLADAGHLSPEGEVLQESRGVEVGNIFQLGTHYSDKMSGASFQTSDGSAQPYYMGCYGIGVERTMATVVELHHDERGIRWPESIAPFAVHLITLRGAEERGAALYAQLIEAGIEVLWDDRDTRPGAKFVDADLIGIPHRLVLSEKTGEKIEYKHRTEEKPTLLTTAELMQKLL